MTRFIEILQQDEGNQTTGKRSLPTVNELALSPNGIGFGAYRFDPKGTDFPDSRRGAVDLGSFDGDGKTGGIWAVGEKGIRYAGFLKQLHHYIDQSLSYPKEFIENDIAGRVEGTLYFGEDGHLILQKSLLKSNSNFIGLWARRHLRKLFENGLPFKAEKRPFRVAILIELEQGSPFVLGGFSKDQENPIDSRNGKKEFTAGGKARNRNLELRNMVASNRLLFYRHASKNYGVGLGGIEDKNFVIPMPIVDFLGLIDRVERVLGISEVQKHERNMLDVLRAHPEWGK